MVFRETKLEVETPINIWGTNVRQIDGSWLTKEKWNRTPPKKAYLERILLPSTVVLGLDETDKAGKCKAEWTINIDDKCGKSVRANLHSVALIIECVRLQEGLHALTSYDSQGQPYPILENGTRNPTPTAEVTISVNEKEIIFSDKLSNDSKMIHGKDLGFGNIVEYRLDSFIDKLKQSEKWTITLEVSEGVYWGIDFLRWEIITIRKRVKDWVYFVLGIFFGWLPNLGWLQNMFTNISLEENLIMIIVTIGFIILIGYIIFRLSRPHQNKEKVETKPENDKFLLTFIDGGHKGILQWIAVWLGSGIGTIQVIFRLLDSQVLYHERIIYWGIYLSLISLMTISLYEINYVMHLQNGWVNLMDSKDYKKLYKNSRGEFWKSIVGQDEAFSRSTWLSIICPYAFLVGFGILIWFVK